MTLFEAYFDGFMEGCRGSLTPKEVEALPMGAKIMTFECGMRFLTDYLQGDTYFKIHYPEQNLDRTKMGNHGTDRKKINDFIHFAE